MARQATDRLDSITKASQNTRLAEGNFFGGDMSLLCHGLRIETHRIGFLYFPSAIQAFIAKDGDANRPVFEDVAPVHRPCVERQRGITHWV
jgi:hypothetical protein